MLWFRRKLISRFGSTRLMHALGKASAREILQNTYLVLNSHVVQFKDHYTGETIEDIAGAPGLVGRHIGAGPIPTQGSPPR